MHMNKPNLTKFNPQKEIRRGCICLVRRSKLRWQYHKRPRFIYEYQRKDREIKTNHSALEKGMGEVDGLIKVANQFNLLLCHSWIYYYVTAGFTTMSQLDLIFLNCGTILLVVVLVWLPGSMCCDVLFVEIAIFFFVSF